MRYGIMFLLVVICLGCDQNDEDIMTVNLVKTTVVYDAINGVDPNLLSLDVYHREDLLGSRPVIFYVHGGAWAIGDKSNSLENKIALAQRLNYVFVSVNYRLSPTIADLDPNRIKFPIHSQDVAKAFKWVFINIDDYGGDPLKIAAMGHSAGAHLVALMGTNISFLENQEVPISALKGVAIIDTEGYDVREKILEGNEVYINAFGTDEVENLAASPLYHVADASQGTKFFIAKRGTLQRIQEADEFITALNANGIQTFPLEASVYTHNGINDAIGKPNETLITNPLIGFFQACFE